MSTPREKFQRDKQAMKSHASLVDDTFTESTFDIALSEMMWRQGSGSIAEGVIEHHRLQGAKEFIKIWRGLSSTKEDESTAEEYRKMYAGGLQPEDEELHPPRKK